MSSSKQLEEKRAAERKAKAMKMNYTKVKPTVVKHILPDEVMSIYDIKVSKPFYDLKRILISAQTYSNYCRPT